MAMISRNEDNRASCHRQRGSFCRQNRSEAGNERRSQRLKHAAPGPYLGFALQPVRVCFHLLDSPKGARSAGTPRRRGRALRRRIGDARADEERAEKQSARRLGEISGRRSQTGSMRYRPARFLPAPNSSCTSRRRIKVRCTVDERRLDVRRGCCIRRSGEVEAREAKKAKVCEPHLQTSWSTAERQTAVVTQFELLSTDVDPLNRLREILRKRWRLN